ncbi:MAG TPA: ABC transporter ATP-binding protein [Herpetosiphonaceae bacterium]
MSAAIETINLTKRYGHTVALDQLNLNVAPGTIYGFVGPNGAGKTTTLRMLAGLLEPSSGEIRLLGERLDREGRASQRLVGYMPDFFGVYDDLRVWEYLDFFARCYNLPAAKRRSTVEGLLDLVDLTPKRDAFVQSLSRGMQQRLCLAHALVHDPPILLLDEPASGLDPRARVELRELLRTLRDMGKTIVLSSHILSELAEVCTALGIMQSGRLIASGALDDVMRQLGDTRRLKLALVRGLEQAQAVLHATPGVGAVEVVDEGAPDTASGVVTLLVEWDGNPEATADLIERLVKAGAGLAAFGSTTNDLEELFLQIATA